MYFATFCILSMCVYVMYKMDSCMMGNVFMPVCVICMFCWLCVYVWAFFTLCMCCMCVMYVEYVIFVMH